MRWRKRTMDPRDAELETFFFVPFLLFNHHQWVMRWDERHVIHLESAFSPHVVYFLYYFYAISFLTKKVKKKRAVKHRCWHDMFNTWMNDKKYEAEERSSAGKKTLVYSCKYCNQAMVRNKKGWKFEYKVYMTQKAKLFSGFEQTFSCSPSRVPSMFHPMVGEWNKNKLFQIFISSFMLYSRGEFVENGLTQKAYEHDKVSTIIFRNLFPSSVETQTRFSPFLSDFKQSKVRTNRLREQGHLKYEHISTDIAVRSP